MNSVTTLKSFVSPGSNPCESCKIKCALSIKFMADVGLSRLIVRYLVGNGQCRADLDGERRTYSYVDLEALDNPVVEVPPSRG